MTICEDSISIPDSQLFSRQNSRSGSISFQPVPSPPHPLLLQGLAQPATEQLVFSGASSAPSSTPFSRFPVTDSRPSSCSPIPTPFLQHHSNINNVQASASALPTPRPSPKRLLTPLARQESSFTQEEINRYDFDPLGHTHARGY